MKPNTKPKKRRKHLYIMGKKVKIPWKTVFITLLVLALFFGVFYLFLRPPIANLFVKNGAEQFSKQNEASAEKYYLLALKLDSKNVSARENLADLYIKQEKYDKAETLLKTGISIRQGYVNYYKKLIDLYMQSDRVEKALEFLSTINQDYVLRQLNKDRPEAIFSSPAQGKYESAIKVTLSAGENEKIYYTTDGTMPNLKSNLYDGPISIKTGKVTIRAFAINDKGLISDELIISYDINTDDHRIKFSDDKIEKMIRNQIGNSRGSIYPRDLTNVTKLSNYTNSGEKIEGNIEKLDDLQWLPSLNELSIKNESSISSFQQLSSCTNLKSLTLSECSLTNDDISILANMTKLESLDLSGNQLDKFDSLKKLLNLKHLNLSKNTFSSLKGIENMKSLTSLNISYNKLKDLKDISSLFILKSLDTSYNNISSLNDIKQLKKIETLNVSSNLLKSLSGIEKMTGIRNIIASHNSLSDFSALSELLMINELNVSNNALTNIRWANSLPIKNLNVSDNRISNISDVESIRELVSLNINNNKISSVSALSSLNNLEIVYMNNNNVKDISPLALCPKLKNIYCKGNKIDKAPVMKNNANVFLS